MNTDCWWCGRADNEGVIVDDNGDRFHYCHRHEAEVKSLIVEPEDA
jgi:hypothetical protein